MASVSPLGQIVILNGAPRSGKSRIAAAIQNTFDGVWINLGVDRYQQMIPPRSQPGIGLRPGGERPDLEPLIVRMYAALYESIAAHSRLGLNVVVDVGHHDAYSAPRGILLTCARRLVGLPVLFVGVRCAIEVVAQRRLATWGGDEETALKAARLWEQPVHSPGMYDLEVDTSVLSSEECADLIRRRLEDGPSGSAIERLVGPRYMDRCGFTLFRSSS